MVKAIVTKVGDDRSSYVTGPYRTEDELIRNHQPPWHWEGSTVRFDVYDVDEQLKAESQPINSTYRKV